MDNNNRGTGWRGGRGGWINRNPWRWRNRNRGGGGRGRGVDVNVQNEANKAAEGDNGPALGLMGPPTSRPYNGHGRGRGGSSNGQGSGKSSNNGAPPPPKKRRKTVKDAIVTAWKKKLPGYRLYYPDSPPQLPDIDRKIHLISNYLSRKGCLTPQSIYDIDEQEYFEVICEVVATDRIFMEEWPDFIKDLNEEPAEVVNLWGACMHKSVTDYIKSVEENEHQDDSILDNDCRGKEGKVVNNVGKINAGLMKAEPLTQLFRINSSHLGKFVAIRGQVAGTSTIRAICLQMPFQCKICDTEFLVDQPYGIYTLPTRCGASEDCDNKQHFEPRETSENIVMMNCRKIKLQDIQNYEVERGGVPKTIECELTNGLVHLVNTGDTVTLTGIIKMKKEFHFNGEQSLHNLYMEAIAMRSHRESERTMGGCWFSFSDLDYCFIREMYDAPNVFKLLVASLCPSIYGHEFVKAALILSLFGGTAHVDDILHRRSDINILMIGDPGIGKSQLLKIITEVAPRGVYVCGTGSTVAGLTVTLVRDGDEYSLEAGALVMGDRGVCCIDEFDKMVPQHPALLEAMEQQSVSIAKSGVFRTLPARTTVIAAANPVGGHYDQRKSLSENIKISSALLSRFDITFILLDKPNEDFDQRIVDHIMGVRKRASTSSTSGSTNSTQQSYDSVRGVPLIDRLKLSQSETLELIPHSLLRKYIAYAKQYVKPKISPEAAGILKEYYLRLRVKHRMHDSTPITTRQLESLLRLTEARAKLELREEATADDAMDVLEIFESSLSSAFDDEVIAISAHSQSILIGTPAPSGRSQTKNQAKRLVAALQRLAEQQCKNIFTVEEIKQTVSSLGLKSTADSLIAGLNNEGYLLKKGARVYQLQTADY